MEKQILDKMEKDGLSVIEDFNLSDEIKEQYLKRKGEVISILEGYKSQLEIVNKQYKKLIEEKALYETVVRLENKVQELKPFVKKAKQVIATEKKQKFLSGCLDTIKKVEERIAKVQKIVDKYFTETINEENHKLDINPQTLVFIEIMENIE